MGEGIWIGSTHGPELTQFRSVPFRGSRSCPENGLKPLRLQRCPIDM